MTRRTLLLTLALAPMAAMFRRPADPRETWNRFRRAARDAADRPTPNVPDGFKTAFARFRAHADP